MSEMVVTIVAGEEIYLNRDRYTLESFEKALAEISEKTKEEIESVIIEGDERATYRLMITVLDLLRKRGFVGINLRLREDTAEPGS